MSNNTLQNLSLKQLKRAVEIREKLEVLEAELTQLLGVAASPSPVSTAVRAVKKTMSAAARRKISAAQKAGWAVRKGQAAPEKPATPKKRRISAQGRANIAAAARARWAKLRAAKGKVA